MVGAAPWGEAPKVGSRFCTAFSTKLASITNSFMTAVFVGRGARLSQLQAPRSGKGKKDARRLDHEPGILCDLIHRLAFLLSSFSFKEKKEKGKERRILSTYPHMKGKKTTFI